MQDVVTPAGPPACEVVSAAIRPLLEDAGDQPQVQMAEVDGTMHIYLAFPRQISTRLREEVRHAARWAYIGLIPERDDTVAHVAWSSRYPPAPPDTSPAPATKRRRDSWISEI